ncbi:phycobilisome rod-core linker polypeptide CpcG [Leptolyngbyaceae cyanobacterium CCMR0082]|uniref:Phycobilisome rod-core linker polypeptide CpcG n=2 Tax=Adonisia turfae TaxID=2950184 RepID=A0A6M0S0Z3_9CYAN|nr:phycobilisome rod-core linker polypeptide [Adonisia turfae]MDV3349030.1 phycobilisome rod-core linker polypeptide [Leptothoe sp. LEGE 181152]NEZ58057.1 phycobilisome rod-core linker polypeptide CpcG [Adonisia turfae CCMR0081]NEZ62056.1 phycobilisome rod-core linker polypeptide CpcG [Adonisia turfae CCMR0082]
MTIPVLAYNPTSQNIRVAALGVGNEESPKIFSTNTLPNALEIDALIYAAYRQIFNEQQTIAHNRQRFLESQLRSSQITVRDFIRGLVTADSFRRYVYDCNNNYRFVQLCVQRMLGRDIYSQAESRAWSIVLATKGLTGFIDALLDSDEYLNTFGDDTVPYQRRRILPQRAVGELPFARMSRYGLGHLEQLMELGYDYVARPLVPSWWEFPKAPASPLPYVVVSLMTFAALYLIAFVPMASS